MGVGADFCLKGVTVLEDNAFTFFLNKDLCVCLHMCVHVCLPACMGICAHVFVGKYTAVGIGCL